MNALATTGALLGLIHTLAGPDHYLPFIAMARAGRWSLARTTAVTLVCGLAHVGSSVVLGMLGIALGWGIASVQGFESARGDVAAWLFIGFGIAYMVWGLRRARKTLPHTHVGGHAQVPMKVIGPWALFLIFVFGPCEPLIPLLMYPASQQSWLGVALVTATFAAATLAAMVLMVLCGMYGLSWTSLGRLERYDHALAGFALFACGVAIRFGL